MGTQIFGDKEVRVLDTDELIISAGLLKKLNRWADKILKICRGEKID